MWGARQEPRLVSISARMDRARSPSGTTPPTRRSAGRATCSTTIMRPPRPDGHRATTCGSSRQEPPTTWRPSAHSATRRSQHSRQRVTRPTVSPATRALSILRQVICISARRFLHLSSREALRSPVSRQISTGTCAMPRRPISVPTKETSTVADSGYWLQTVASPSWLRQRCRPGSRSTAR